MTKIDWDEVADREFYEMDADARAQWAELRQRIGG
jgi:hypothetical protein